jgi:transcriptional regulator with XRE-family HTH domain
MIIIADMFEKVKAKRDSKNILKYTVIVVDINLNMIYNKLQQITLYRREEKFMEATAQRLCELRKSVNLPQIKMAEVLGMSQSMLNRCEHDQQIISDAILMKYADYFDVSLDYICGRTEKPEGKIYMGRPNIGGDNEEIRQFIEMCFDPKTKMNVRLKDTLYRMMAGEQT